MKTEIVAKAKSKYKIIKRRVMGKTHFLAKVVYNRDLGTEEFLRTVIELGSSLTIGDLKAAVEMISKAIKIELNKSNRVTLPWGVYAPAIRGAMKGKDDVFTPGRNRYVVRISVPRSYTKGITENLSPMRARANSRNPELHKLLDTIYKLENLVITSGSIALLKGADLKFDWQDKDQGIFLVGSDGAAIRADFYSDVNDASVRFVVPQLKSGESYQVLLKIFAPAFGDKIEKPLGHPLTADVKPDPEWTEPADKSGDGEIKTEVVSPEFDQPVAEHIADVEPEAEVTEDDAVESEVKAEVSQEEDVPIESEDEEVFDDEDASDE